MCLIQPGQLGESIHIVLVINTIKPVHGLSFLVWVRNRDVHFGELLYGFKFSAEFVHFDKSFCVGPLFLGLDFRFR